MYVELSSTEEATGKVIQSMTRAIDDGQMVIAFMDGTFISLGLEHGYDDDHWVGRQEFALMDFGADALIASGIITEEERAQKVMEYWGERRRAREAAERRRYERLKAKFEPAGGER